MKEIIQVPIPPTHLLKTSYVSGTKIFKRRFTGMFAFQVLSAVLGRLEMVQCKCFLWYQPETCFRLYFGSRFFLRLSDVRFVEYVRFLQ